MSTAVVYAFGAAAGLPHDELLDVDARHPMTHPGCLLSVVLEEGVVVSADPRVGLMHRSAEKLFESRDLRQAMLLANRHDWLAPFTSEVTVALAAEELLGLMPPERATWIRTLLVEVERITASLSFLAVVGGDQRTALEQALARLTSIGERITGARMHPGFARLGGVAAWIVDSDRDLLRQELTALSVALPAWSEAVRTVVAPMSGLATLTANEALAHGLGGPVGRASGVPLDLRRDQPYLAYASLGDELAVVTRDDGDAAARHLVLLDQLTVSGRLTLACLDRLDTLAEGPVNVPLPKVVRLPEATAYAAVEGPLGVSGVLLVGAGDKYPWRMKIRSASFATMAVLPVALRGVPASRLADAVTSFPVVMGDVDR